MSKFLIFCRDISFKLLDRGLLEVCGPQTIANFFLVCSQRLSALSSGYIFHYSFLMVFGVTTIFVLHVFFFETISFELFFFEFFLFSSFMVSYSEASTHL